MSSEPQRITFRVPRRARLAVGVATTVTLLIGGGVWAMSAASAAPVGAGTAQSTSAPASSSASSPVPSGTACGAEATRTSYTWSFEDGTPGGWYGFGYGASFGPGAQRAPWVAPSPAAARSGRGGLLVGGVARFGFYAGTDLTSKQVAPGSYAVSAQVRLAPGQPATLIGVGDGLLVHGAPVSTDAGWTTIDGRVDVFPDGRVSRLLIGPGEAPCWRGSSRETSFHLDQVTVTRMSTVPPTATTVPPTPNCGSPAPDPVVRLHHDVTSTTPGGFTAVLTIHNLQGQDTPILDWSVPLRLDGRRVLWVAGARLVQDGTVPRLTGIPGGPTVAIPGNTTLTISLGLSGSPIGSQHIFGSVPGVPTGWE